MTSPAVESASVEVEGLRVHYRAAGTGHPVLLVHGIPTSSLLWRNVLPRLGDGLRGIAIDLPAFGDSAKPLDVRYGFDFYGRILGGFLDALGVEQTSLVVHDFGGPVALHWAVNHPDRVRRIALLNTIVYPEPSWALVLFMLAVQTPFVRDFVVSPAGVALGLRIGTKDAKWLTPDVIETYQAAVATADARRAMLAASTSLRPRGIREVAEKLPKLGVPLRAIYGEADWILPDVAKTMARIARDCPGTEVTPLPECGHFLQEDDPERLSVLLHDFLGGAA